MNLSTIRIIVGFGFKGFGFFGSLSDKFLCGSLCENCSVSQNNTGSLLLLFVGIIFIICGYALIVMKYKKRISLRKKIKKNFKIVKK